MDKYVEKPGTIDQFVLLREYQKLLLGTPFEQLDLNEYQQYALRAYMRAAAEGKFGAQIAQDLQGWPISFCCSMRKLKRNMSRVQKDLKSTRNPHARARAEKKYLTESHAVPFVRKFSMADAFKLKCLDMSGVDMKKQGITETQLRKMRIVMQGFAAGENFGVLAEKVLITETEIKLMAKILRESEQVKAV